MSAASFLVLAVMGAVILAWPLWFALIAVQAINIAVGAGAFRWLPSGLLAIGFGYALVRSLWQ